MLVDFLGGAARLLTSNGLVLLASKDCYPYSWWRPEALPQWTVGDLELVAEIPWTRTEYPTLYRGPCNVDRDMAVKPTDAVIFVFGHRDHCQAAKRMLSAGTLTCLYRAIVLMFISLCRGNCHLRRSDINGWLLYLTFHGS